MTSCETLAADLAQAMQSYADALTFSGIFIFLLGILAGLCINALIVPRQREAWPE